MDDSRCMVDDGWQLHSLPGLYCGIRQQGPAERELRFRDVVRYLLFEEYTHSGSNNRWTSTDGGDVVTRVIPEEI